MVVFMYKFHCICFITLQSLDLAAIVIVTIVNISVSVSSKL